MHVHIRWVCVGDSRTTLAPLHGPGFRLYILYAGKACEGRRTRIAKTSLN